MANPLSAELQSLNSPLESGLSGGSKDSPAAITAALQDAIVFGQEGTAAHSNGTADTASQPSLVASLRGVSESAQANRVAEAEFGLLWGATPQGEGQRAGSIDLQQLLAAVRSDWIKPAVTEMPVKSVPTPVVQNLLQTELAIGTLAEENAALVQTERPPYASLDRYPSLLLTKNTQSNSNLTGPADPIVPISTAVTPNSVIQSGQDSAAITEAELSTLRSAALNVVAQNTSASSSFVAGSNTSSLSDGVGGSQALTQVQASAIQLASQLNSEGWRAEAFAKLSVLIGRGTERAELQLQPASLGKLIVRMDSSDDATRLSFTVQSAGARDQLEMHLPKLREMFAESGLDLLDVNVQDQSSDRDKGHYSDADQTEKLGTPDDQELNDSYPVALTLARKHPDSSLLDTFA